MWWRELQAQARAATVQADDRKARVDPSAWVAPSARLDVSRGPIFIGARSRVCEGAHIEGPARIGDDCLIGNLAMVRGPVWIGDGTRVGFATEIKNAIVQDRVMIGPQCFVADSKIEHEAYLGAQVRTSNHRFDKGNVKVLEDGIWIDTGLEKLGCLIGARSSLGIQVIVLPGRVIAADTTLAPRITVEKNLPPGRYRLAQQLESF
jgi:UDP-N-acetylglucosamine diphosphorylase / glucose-1-phosphate thymidylyltransferase / UDP-N-acetylgalactosamine diphosphorylase / glucosamine-1-phosphate N-acetyltransferase / galactosamine-1-phosphate N-acetyltransferase